MASAFERIELAWRQRLNGQHGAFLESVDRLSKIMGVFKPQDIPNRSAPPQELIQMFLLLASKSRLQGNSNEAALYVEIVKHYCENQILPLPYEYYFQLGLNFYKKGEYIEAHEAFVQAR